MVDPHSAAEDLHRIERVQDRIVELGRVEQGGPRSIRAVWASAATLWVFLAIQGLPMPKWLEWTVLAVFMTGMISLGIRSGRRTPFAPHRSDISAGWLAGWVSSLVVVVIASAVVLNVWEPPFSSLIWATVTAGAFVLLGYAMQGRWLRPGRGRSGAAR
ncbi:hypothetical protein [Streptomyces tailanensis]|uniref:hypothetical protein n=1 Tax=Streptomyces tailanensis TaxID=2569858 RepID=UPI00122DE1DD|nr:hypothetical protein [Streptomyces tailanensis]